MLLQKFVIPKMWFFGYGNDFNAKNHTNLGDIWTSGLVKLQYSYVDFDIRGISVLFWKLGNLPRKIFWNLFFNAKHKWLLPGVGINDLFARINKLEACKTR